MNNSGRSSLVLVLVIALAGVHLGSSSCSTVEPPQGAPVQFSDVHGDTASGIHYSTPEGWIEESPSSSMRELQFRLPGPEPLGGDAEVAVFTGIGGTVDQNIERWINQFEVTGSPEVDKRVINDFPVTFVDVTGTFSAGMMNPRVASRPDYRMLGAVIERDGATWFVKLVGPQDTVTEWESSFASFVKSLR